MMKYHVHRNIITMLLVLWAAVNCPAQSRDSVYINNTDSIYVNNTDTLSVFGNIIHNGTWGTTTGSYVYFLGQAWKNTSSARFALLNSSNTDGGIFCMVPPAKSVYSQIIQGGYDHNNLSNGPVFPNLEIANPHNIYLDSTDAAVYNTVKMDTGLVYLSANAGGLDNTENSFVLGGGTLKPKVINYNKNKYFVSGVLPENKSYFYIRNVASGDTAVFPVGSKANDYTPAGITSTSGDFMVRAFNGVYQNGGSGALLNDSSFIQKTWQVITPLVATASYTPIFQHNLNNETANFSINRDNSFISMYNSATNSWDAVSPTNPAYVKTSLFPNIGNENDSTFYHWRIISNILNSNQGTYFTKKVNVSGLISINKILIGVNPVLSNNSYDVAYELIVANNNPNAVNNINVTDNLTRAFPSPATFTIKDARSLSGLLTVNSLYNGTTDIYLIKDDTLQSKQVDTIMLIVNVELNSTSDTVFTNTGIAGVTDNNGNFNPVDTSSVGTKLTALNVFIPDGFSPNGDAYNQYFVIGHTSSQTIDLTVFNRWGNIVFKQDNYQNRWDGHGTGNFLGKELEEGTYYALVTIHNIKAGTQQQVIKFITIRRTY